MLKRDITFFNKLVKIVLHYHQNGTTEEYDIAKMIYDMFDISPDLEATGKSWEQIKELIE